MIDCNKWGTEKRHECANMGKVKRLELWWQLYRTSLPVWDVENFRPMDFCWHECTFIRLGTRTTESCYFSLLQQTEGRSHLFLHAFTRLISAWIFTQQLPNCLTLCFLILPIFILSVMCTCHSPLILPAHLLSLKWSYLLENQTSHLIFLPENTILVNLLSVTQHTFHQRLIFSLQ